MLRKYRKNVSDQQTLRGLYRIKLRSCTYLSRPRIVVLTSAGYDSGLSFVYHHVFLARFRHDGGIFVLGYRVGTV